jgi:RNA polymerase primary sigma factor
MSVTELHPGTRRQPPPGRLLSAAEEVALAKRIEQGDLDAKEEMIESNLGLVHALARTYRGRGVPFDDLVQEGTVGLVKAVERFDHRREVKFSTYAVWWIRRSILDALAGSNVIRIPAKANRQLAAVRRERRSSSGAARRAPQTPRSQSTPS